MGDLTLAVSQEVGKKLSSLGDQSSSGDVNTMWGTTIGYIRKVAIEVPGVSRGVFDERRGD